MVIEEIKLITLPLERSGEGEEQSQLHCCPLATSRLLFAPRQGGFHLAALAVLELTTEIFLPLPPRAGVKAVHRIRIHLNKPLLTTKPTHQPQTKSCVKKENCTDH